MKNLTIILSFVLIAGNLLAQPYTSRLGRFRVDQVKGCVPLTLTITDTNLITTGECTAGKPCLMNAGNNTLPQQNQFTITYTQAGSFKLSVLYQNIVKTQKALAANSSSRLSELAGEFSITVSPYPGKSLADMEKLVSEAMVSFEQRGVSVEDVEKA